MKRPSFLTDELQYALAVANLVFADHGLNLQELDDGGSPVTALEVTAAG